MARALLSGKSNEQTTDAQRVDLDDYALAAMQAIVRTVYATMPYKMRPDEIARRAFEIAAAMEQERQRRAHGGP